MAQVMSTEHPRTVADYVALLDRMDALYVIPALREDRLAAAPKKAKKLVFATPSSSMRFAPGWTRPRIRSGTRCRLLPQIRPGH